jgi:hypothetical protein
MATPPPSSSPKRPNASPAEASSGHGQIPHPVVLVGTVSATLFGIFAALFGVLPGWVAVGVAGAAFCFAGAAWKVGRLPVRAFELFGITICSVLLAFAARGIKETLQPGHVAHRFRVASGYRVPVFYEPVAGAETTEAYSLGDEIEVRCRYVDPKGEEWYWIDGTLNDIKNPWIPAGEVVPYFPRPSGTPPQC